MSRPEYSDVEEMSNSEFMALREVELRDLGVAVRSLEFVRIVWTRTYEYRGVKYNIGMLRYLRGDGNIGMNRYGKWFVLEHPEETGKMIANSPVDAECLYKDTLHAWNDGQTLEQMFYEMVDYAKRDIDELLGE